MKMLSCVCNVQYKMPQSTHESNGCPYSLRPMVFIYNVNHETSIFTWLKELTNTSKECGTKNILYYTPSKPWIMIALRTKQIPNKGNAVGRILRCAYENRIYIHSHTHTHIYIYIYIYIGLLKAINFEASHYILFTSSILHSLYRAQIIFYLRPPHQIP